MAGIHRRGPEFGIVGGGWKVDMAAVRDRKRKMVDGLVMMHLQKYQASGAELVMGQGRFVAPRTIEVAPTDGGTRVLRGKIVVINAGTRAKIEPIPGLLEARLLTHVEALELDHLPGHLIVLGGGYVGLELAQAFRRFGGRATIIEENDRLAHREDPDVSEALRALCDDEGIDVRTGTSIDRVDGSSGESVRLHATREAALHGPAGCHPHPPDDGGGAQLALRDRAGRGPNKVNGHSPASTI